MGMIINIDEALKNRSTYNILAEPMHEMLKEQQEAFEKSNPLDMIYVRNTLSGFQETYSSSIGFAHAFGETSDYAVGPIFNEAEGFTATYRSRTFQGGFIISRQVLEDMQYNKVKDTASKFLTAWNRDVVFYGIKALEGAFGKPAYFGDKTTGISKLLLNSADTRSGEIDDPVKNPLFYKEHTAVKRDDVDGPVIKQSNIFAAELEIGGSDAGQISKLADVINQVITEMENYKDDNGQITGVMGAKTIVAGNNAHLKAALSTALSTDVFMQGETKFTNVAKNIATLEVSPYFNSIPQCKDGVGFFIVDKAYNEGNHGPEFTERIPLTLEAFDKREAPQGIKYEGRQRFDINVASWRGIAYVYIGKLSDTSTDWNYKENFTKITPTATIVKPVTVVGTVKTE